MKAVIRAICSCLSVLAGFAALGSMGAVELHQISWLQGLLQFFGCNIVGLFFLLLAMPDKKPRDK